MPAMNIDRLVLDYHACDSQDQLNRFWDRVPENMHEVLIERLEELFPRDPNECDCDPYRMRTYALNRGMEEWMATMMARTSARCCTEREGRTEPCERCEQFQLDFPDPA
jgi:hypothetical protein